MKLPYDNRRLSKLDEQSKYTSDAKMEVLSHMQPILIHICKIYYLPHSREYHHWRKEVANWLTYLSKIKLKSKSSRFDSNWLLKALYQDIIESREDLSNFVRNMVNPDLQEDYIDPKRVTQKDWNTFLGLYSMIALRVRNQDLISYNDVYKLLDSIL